MTNRPITPTRIIPAGAPLPNRGPHTGEIPPWREQPAPAAPPPAGPAAPPAPLAVPTPPPPPSPEPPPVHVHVTVQPGPYYDPVEPTRRERFWAWLRTFGRPWQIAGALLLTVLPVPYTHYSAMATAAYATAQARVHWGAPTGYVIALIPLAWACAHTRRRPTVLRLCIVAISLGGLLGALDPFDLVTAYTGVHR
ncbi:hypothetical protein [Streptomyces sp. NPDC057509]|uniref:hypothetical protein n=1 Tax=Streptomyces sp. NPDC057509 TaxID=3346152 RepID=UPI00367743AE